MAKAPHAWKRQGGTLVVGPCTPLVRLTLGELKAWNEGRAARLTTRGREVA
jgi:hypothetical protein